MLFKQIITALLLTFLIFPGNAFSEEWLTYYEQHQKNRTPGYSETIEFSQRLANASPLLHYTTFGTSHQQRPLPLLILDSDKNFTVEQVKASGKVVLLVQACIHPGEPVGKDAGLQLLRDIVIHGKYAHLLENVTILFIPIFNVDGHERFGPYNRINQDGPEEMGWRTNAVNLNLNRDFLKADSQEMQHFIQLWDQWQPDFFIDTHSTNGGDYQYPMTYILETFGNMDNELTQWCTEVYIPEWQEAMEEDGFPIFPYVSYRQWHDPRSGLYSGASPPALSNGYAAARNRPGLLLETHMMKPYEVRVESTYLTLVHTLEILDREHNTLRKLVSQADQRVATEEFRSHPLPLAFTTSDDSVIVDFRGVDYYEKTSTLSGGQWFIYDNQKPITYQIPYYKNLDASVSAMLPEAYIIPVEWQTVIQRLALHGIKMQILEKDTSITVDSYRFEDVVLSASSNEGRQTARFNALPITETRVFHAGSAVISMSQPTARLIAHALEPQAPSSFVYWGFFNSIFQRTEYFESYVMETMARQMLQDDKDLKERFENKLSSDAEFASNPRAILNWFYEQTPYVDQKHNIYPVGKIMN